MCVCLVFVYIYRSIYENTDDALLVGFQQQKIFKWFSIVIKVWGIETLMYLSFATKKLIIYVQIKYTFILKWVIIFMYIAHILSYIKTYVQKVVAKV